MRLFHATSACTYLLQHGDDLLRRSCRAMRQMAVAVATKVEEGLSEVVLDPCLPKERQTEALT